MHSWKHKQKKTRLIYHSWKLKRKLSQLVTHTWHLSFFVAAAVVRKNNSLTLTKNHISNSLRLCSFYLSVFTLLNKSVRWFINIIKHTGMHACTKGYNTSQHNITKNNTCIALHNTTSQHHQAQYHITKHSTAQ